ncbi:hypothetical protein CROQUDRAFT_108191 [Cronartium quercuum f. sp. fusiforme G11]|uniref:Protein kinase domain-containing protein n=1 Tax=Cronartium quercuum f. sp. fusiforme G11 TaxID=708437 RepID=A0A9P6NDU9_9BASI|nr:hypothetical protein CROQUDRAFT_108191 [Cronartium quercuum f. sp. fusiforme G11]
MTISSRKRLRTQNQSISKKSFHQSSSDSQSESRSNSISTLTTRRRTRLTHRLPTTTTNNSLSRVLSPLPHQHNSLQRKFDSVPIRLNQLCQPLTRTLSNQRLQDTRPSRKRKRGSPNENHLQLTTSSPQSISLTKVNHRIRGTQHRSRSSSRPTSSSTEDGRTDQYYLQKATKTQLGRLKRDDLLRLGQLISPQIEIESPTKDFLINLIIQSRATTTTTSSSSTPAGISSSEQPVRRQSNRTTLPSPPYTRRHKSLPNRTSSNLQETSDEDEVGETEEIQRRKRKVTFDNSNGMKRVSTPVAHRTRLHSAGNSNNHTNNEVKGSSGRLTRSQSKLQLESQLKDRKGDESADDEGSESDDEGEEEEEEEEEEDEIEEVEAETSGTVGVDFDDEEEEEEEEEEAEESMSEDEDDSVDLTRATSKALLRLKRVNLIKLCEQREIEVEGTKKELVQNLLLWRDTNENDGFSQSSEINHTSSENENEEEEVEEEEEEGKEEEEEDEEEEEEITTTTIQELQSNNSQINERKEDSRPLLLQSNHLNHTEQAIIQTPGKKDELGELLDLESLNLQDKEIQFDQLKKLEMIGSGGFKDVYRGLYKKVQVAIADIRGHLTEMDIKELKILRDLRHENIVRFIGVSVPDSINNKKVPIMIITEICTNGDLFDYIRSTPSPGLIKILSIFKDICRGLDYLHSRQPVIIHRDLKSSNVLITSKGVAKLNDFVYIYIYIYIAHHFNLCFLSDRISMMFYLFCLFACHFDDFSNIMNTNTVCFHLYRTVIDCVCVCVIMFYFYFLFLY